MQNDYSNNGTLWITMQHLHFKEDTKSFVIFQAVHSQHLFGTFTNGVPCHTNFPTSCCIWRYCENPILRFSKENNHKLPSKLFFQLKFRICDCFACVHEFLRHILGTFLLEMWVNLMTNMINRRQWMNLVNSVYSIPFQLE